MLIYFNQAFYWNENLKLSMSQNFAILKNNDVLLHKKINVKNIVRLNVSNKQSLNRQNKN